MATDASVQTGDVLTKQELINLGMNREQVEFYFAQKKQRVMLGHTKPLTIEDLDATERLYTGRSEAASRDFSKANTVARWVYTALDSDRQHLLQVISGIRAMIEAGEPVTLDKLSERFSGYKFKKKLPNTPALLEARRTNIAKARKVRAAKNSHKKSGKKGGRA